jgi:hypothetical protein
MKSKKNQVRNPTLWDQGDFETYGTSIASHIDNLSAQQFGNYTTLVPKQGLKGTSDHHDTSNGHPAVAYDLPDRYISGGPHTSYGADHQGVPVAVTHQAECYGHQLASKDLPSSNESDPGRDLTANYA